LRRHEALSVLVESRRESPSGLLAATLLELLDDQSAKPMLQHRPAGHRVVETAELEEAAVDRPRIGELRARALEQLRDDLW
jgi:hypothetical protein